MGTMTLLDVVRDLNKFDQESTIYAMEPWTVDSKVMLIREDESETALRELKKQGFKYFLEVFLAHDFIEDWEIGLLKPPTLQEKCLRLIQYAVKDA